MNIHPITPPPAINWTSLPEEQFIEKFGTFAAGNFICELRDFDFTGWEITMSGPHDLEGIATKGEQIVYLETYRDQCVWQITHQCKE